MTGITNLYPPILEPYLPAFNKDSETIEVQFQRSSFNSADDINLECTQIKIDYQDTNISALNSERYPTGIKFVTPTQVNGKANTYKIELTINGNNKDFEFNTNRYYKLQIRFAAKTLTKPSGDYPTVQWQSDNKDRFSAWSTVCLMKGIVPPTFNLTCGSMVDGIINTSSANFTVAGEFDFEPNEKEHIKNYSVELLNGSQSLYKSDKIYTSYGEPNQINHLIKYRLSSEIDYTLKLHYETNNMYTGVQTYGLQHILSGYPVPKLAISATNHYATGRIKLTLSPVDGGVVYSGLIITRSSSLDNFLVWEDVHMTLLDKPSIDEYVWYDDTVENGVYYKYAVQKSGVNGERGFAIETNKPVLAEFEDMFLTTADRQLNIKLNPQINSFSIQVSEALTETIGSKYPFVRRNGDMRYKTFNISGLISSFCDKENLFVSPEEIYGEHLDLYESHEEITNNYCNFIYEKDFREKVIEFLYDNNVKLFRSPAEGNILIKLTNISLMPQETLGRMLYSFQATATEIADINRDNYIQYGIVRQHVLTTNPASDYAYATQTSAIVCKVTELYDNYQNNVLNVLLKKLQEQNPEYPTIKIDKILSLKIDFNDEELRRVGYNTDGSLKLVTNNTEAGITGLFFTVQHYGDRAKEDILVTPTTQIVTQSNGLEDVENALFFEFSDDMDYLSNIMSISFPKDADYDVTITAVVQPKVALDANDYNIVTYRDIQRTYSVGQFIGAFSSIWSFAHAMTDRYNQTIGNKIYDYETVDYVYIESTPGAIVVVTTKNNGIKQYVLDNNAILEVPDTIMDIQFKGIKYTPVSSNNPGEGQCHITTLSLPVNAADCNERYVYKSENKQVIWLNNKVYTYNNGTVEEPVEALINYHFTMREASVI